MAKFDKQSFSQKCFWHDTSSFIYLYWLCKISESFSKSFVQVDFPVCALSKHKQKPCLKANKAVILSKQFLASNFFMQVFNVSILYRQSIRLFQQKL